MSIWPINLLETMFRILLSPKLAPLQTISLIVCILLCRKVGWDSKPGESHLNSLLRGQVFAALATFGHDKTQLDAMERFQVLLKDKDTKILSPEVRKVK